MADGQPNPADPSQKSKVTTTKPVKPRAGVQRKSKAQREQYAKKETERQQSRNEVDTTTDGFISQNSTGTGVGNGAVNTPVTRSDRSRPDTTGGSSTGSSGVFGVGSGSKPHKRQSIVATNPPGEDQLVEGKLAAKRDDSGPSNATEQVQKTDKIPKAIPKKTERSKKSVRAEELISVYSSDESDEQARDIEMIWISSDEDDEDVVNSRRKQNSIFAQVKSGPSLRPIRAPRIQLEEQKETQLVRSNSSKTDKKNADIEMYDVEGDVDITGGDEWEILKEPPMSSTQKRRPIKKPIGRAKDRKMSETAAERSEQLRMNQDVRKMREEFLNVRPLEVSSRQNAAENDLLNMHKKDDTSSKLMLFQFPPMTPFLVGPTAQSSTIDTHTEPNTVTTPENSSPQIKKEPDAPQNPSSAIPPTGILTASSKQRLPSGYVGKLQIHKSGKVTLDWGGTNMEVRYGTEVDFLQDAVLLRPNVPANDVEVSVKGKEKEIDENHVDPHSKGIGTAFSLGQVRKKMVVIPDWAKLYD